MVALSCRIHITALNCLYPSYFHSKEGYCPVFFFIKRCKPASAVVFGKCLICERYGREHCQFECILLIMVFNRGTFCDGTENACFGARASLLKSG